RFTILERRRTQGETIAMKRFIAAQPRHRELAVACANVAQCLAEPGGNMFEHSQTLLSRQVSRACAAPPARWQGRKGTKLSKNFIGNHLGAKPVDETGHRPSRALRESGGSIGYRPGGRYTGDATDFLAARQASGDGNGLRGHARLVRWRRRFQLGSPDRGDAYSHAHADNLDLLPARPAGLGARPVAGMVPVPEPARRERQRRVAHERAKLHR